MMGFWESKEWQEIYDLLVPGQYFCLQNVSTINGEILAASVRDDEFPGSDLIEVNDEELLAKLRNINGQFVSNDGHVDLPIFHYEHLMSTADFKVYVKTGKLPRRSQVGSLSGVHIRVRTHGAYFVAVGHLRKSPAPSEPPTAMMGSTDDLSISRYWESLDGSGMTRQSNHWGNLGNAKWPLGSVERMKAQGGREVPPGSGFFVFDKPLTGFIRFADMTPLK